MRHTNEMMNASGIYIYIYIYTTHFFHVLFADLIGLARNMQMQPPAQPVPLPSQQPLIQEQPMQSPIHQGLQQPPLPLQQSPMHQSPMQPPPMQQPPMQHSPMHQQPLMQQSFQQPLQQPLQQLPRQTPDKAWWFGQEVSVQTGFF